MTIGHQALYPNLVWVHAYMVVVDTHTIAKVAIELLCRMLIDHDLTTVNRNTSRTQWTRRHNIFVTRNEEASKSNAFWAKYIEVIYRHCRRSKNRRL